MATVAIADNHEEIESDVRVSFPCKWFPTTSPSINRSGAITTMLVTNSGKSVLSFFFLRLHDIFLKT